MILRQAESENYEIIKKLYEDKEGTYQWLWGSGSEEETDNVEEPLFIYTREQFEKERFSKRDKLYLMWRENEVLGYLHLAEYVKGEYRMLEWGMFQPEDEMAKEETLKELENKKFLRTIVICTPSQEVSDWLKVHSFTKCGSFFKKFQ